MPIIFTDNHTCELCGKVFEWNHFELKCQNINSPEFKPEPFPQRKLLVRKCYQRDIGIYDVEVNCPDCHFDNHFTYTANDE